MMLLTFFILTILSSVQCKGRKISCKDIREFVDGHNARRLLLAEGKVPGQPAASEMKEIVWHEELQDKAAKWASRNARNGAVLSRHNFDKSIPSGKFKTSQNIYSYTTTDSHYKLKPNSVLEEWFIEHRNFTFGPLQFEHFTGGYPKIGHYTQMVWSDSIYLGCAISKTSKKGLLKFFVVCDYGPAGNYVGQEPYKTEGGASGTLICDHEDCSRPYGKKC